MKFLLLTLFPEMFEGPLSESILQRAQEKDIISVQSKNIRDFGTGKHKQVDDVPYGGGAGMVMKPDILADALRWAKDQMPEAKIVFFTPQGEPLTQKKCHEFAEQKTPLILLCGHYEGVDERVREMFVDEEISLGDFVLTGGEIPAMAFVDSITRLLPGALGNDESTQTESFSDEFGGRLEHPQYTRPEEFEGMKVPKILLSGNHAEIEKWRKKHLRGFTDREKEIFLIREIYFSPAKPWKSRMTLLRTYVESDLEHWMQWFNDEEIVQYLCLETPYTSEDAENYFEKRKTSFDGLYFTVSDRNTREPIGTASVKAKSCDVHSHVGDLAICLGEKQLWGQGYGTEIVRELLSIGFGILGFQKISLQVFKENIAALRMYERCGFQTVGEAKKEVKKKNKLYDLSNMELLKSEWEKGREEDEVTRKYLNLRGDFEI